MTGKDYENALGWMASQPEQKPVVLAETLGLGLAAEPLRVGKSVLLECWQPVSVGIEIRVDGAALGLCLCPPSVVDCRLIWCFVVATVVLLCLMVVLLHS